MPQPNPPVLDFLAARRSHARKSLAPPAPDRAALAAMLNVALRVPDHGGLAPWRLVVLGRGALDDLAALAADRGARLGLDDEQIAKGRGQFAEAALIVAVIAAPRPHPKVPAAEQILSAGALCHNLVAVALASGWGACWITGWCAHDPVFAREGLGLAEGESVAGFVHIATPTRVPADRPRPDLDAVTDWRM